MSLFRKASAALVPLVLATGAVAQTVPPPADPAAPPAAAAPTDAGSICTDRPTKSNFACTVPAGWFQVETDLFNWSRSTVGDTRTDVFLYTNPTAKYGVGPSTDLEINWIPDERVRIRSGAVVTTQDGTGDIYFRVKQRLTGASDAVSVSLLPYIKAPTAPRGIGNRAWEGGLIVPVNVTLPKGLTLTMVPEGDVVADGDGSGGHHGQFTGLVNLGKALTPSTTLYGEVWTSQNFDPTGRVSMVSADFAVARTIGKNVQADFGGNFGLTRATPDVQLYFGISFRFR